MNQSLKLLLLGTLLLAPLPAGAQEAAALNFGGDQYTAGRNIAVDAAVERDVFMAGSDVRLTGAVTGDAHLAGFDVDVTGPISGDVYAMGFSVDITNSVGGDVTAAGNSVTLRSTAPVGGNARLSGASVTIGTPILGSALIATETLTLDAPVTGDLSFFGKSVTFGPGARVDGTFSIQAPEQIAVPATVAAADRVSFTQFTSPDYVTETGRTAAETVVQRFWPALWVAALGWLALLVIGAVLIALAPKALERMRVISEKRPFRNIGIGILAFAALLGLVPVVALTIIGILALPFVFIFVGVAFLVGYLSGAYFVGLKVAAAFMPVDTNMKRVLVLAVALIAAGLLAMIPVAGWLLSLLLTIYGLGVIMVVLMVRWSAKDAVRLAAADATPATT